MVDFKSMPRHDQIGYLVFAAQWVMSVNYEFWCENKNSSIAKVRGVSLVAKTRCLIAHDRVLLQVFNCQDSVF